MACQGNKYMVSMPYKGFNEAWRKSFEQAAEELGKPPSYLRESKIKFSTMKVLEQE